MFSGDFILSNSAFAGAKRAMRIACFLIAGSNIVLHIGMDGHESNAELLGANAFFLWAAYCFVRLCTYSTVSLVVFRDGTVQAFDGMLRDLGVYRGGDVTYSSSGNSDQRGRILLHIPELGTVSLAVNDTADTAAILRRAGVAAGNERSPRAHLLLAISAVVALTSTAILLIEAVRALREMAISQDFLFLSVAYLGLLSFVALFRMKTSIRIKPLLRRIIF